MNIFGLVEVDIAVMGARNGPNFCSYVRGWVDESLEGSLFFSHAKINKADNKSINIFRLIMMKMIRANGIHT
jgi:hypothetical protein